MWYIFARWNISYEEFYSLEEISGFAVWRKYVFIGCRKFLDLLSGGNIYLLAGGNFWICWLEEILDLLAGGRFWS